VCVCVGGGSNKERNAELTSEGIIRMHVSLCAATPGGISVRVPMLLIVMIHCGWIHLV